MKSASLILVGLIDLAAAEFSPSPVNCFFLTGLLSLASAGCGTPFSFCLEEVELAFRHGHHGLVSETGEIPIKVLVVLGGDVLGEVVARDQEVGFEDDADGVIEGGPSRK